MHQPGHRPAPAHPPQPRSGAFAAPGLSLLWNSSETSECGEVLVSEKSLNTNIKALQDELPTLTPPGPPQKNPKPKQTTHIFYAKRNSASVSPQKIILGKVLPGKGSNPHEQARCYYNRCLPPFAHTQDHLQASDVPEGEAPSQRHPRGLATLPSLSWDKPPTVVVRAL